MRTRFIVSALIKNDDQYLFIRQNKPTGAYPHTLHIPGGGINDGEDPAEAVRREIEEEVGLEVENLEPFDFDWDITNYRSEPTLLVFLRFTGDSRGTDAQAGSDAAEVLWIPRDELGKHSHNEPSKRLLRRLGLIE